MGRVLLAHDPVLDRDVAVKHLREDLKIPRSARQGLLKRMRHEARAAARVSHPNLVVLHDMGEDPVLGLYLVFEYVEGPTLKERLIEGPLPPSEVGRLAADLGDALTVAHEAGILHRDVKPENLMLSRWGGKIADFGIARIPDSTLTHQGGLMGTPAYSAPETFRQDGGRFSPESDQFSLAASMYEALAGTRAFPGDDAMVVATRILQGPPAPFAAELGLPPAVDSILARGLSRKPENRFRTARAFGEALLSSLSETKSVEQAAPGTPPATTPVPSPAPVGVPPPRRTMQILLGAAAVVVTGALLVRSARHSIQTPPPALSVVTSTSSKPQETAGDLPVPASTVVPAREARPAPPTYGHRSRAARPLGTASARTRTPVAPPVAPASSAVTDAGTAPTPAEPVDTDPDSESGAAP